MYNKWGIQILNLNKLTPRTVLSNKIAISHMWLSRFKLIKFYKTVNLVSSLATLHIFTRYICLVATIIRQYRNIRIFAESSIEAKLSLYTTSLPLYFYITLLD